MAENKDTVIHLEDQGSIHIAEDVVSAIASLASSEIDGVSMMATGPGGVAELLGKKNLSRGVKITILDNVVSVDVYIMVAHGVVIPKVAAKIQEKVKSSLESMTGLNVSEVHVHVGGITFDKEIKK